MKPKNAKPQDANVHYGFIADDAEGCAAQMVGEAVLRRDVAAAVAEVVRKIRRVDREDHGRS